MPEKSSSATKLTVAKNDRIVIKIGSALLVDHASGQIRTGWLKALANDINSLKERGAIPLIVSSGSIALGRSVLGFGTEPLALEQSQAAAAVGQIRLAQAYEEVLALHGLVAAQILLTLDDSSNRRRYLNSRATFANLLSQSVVPVVNENDTVATDEIRFGDNDRLAAQVAAMTNSSCMILLSDIDGLYESNPRLDPAAKHIPVIKRITPETEAMASDSQSVISRGGMRTKLIAAKTAVNAGCTTVIADGTKEHALAGLLEGARFTRILPQGDPQSARKDWIGSMNPKGRLQVDRGAFEALKRGKSLLPAGVTCVSGDFDRGDPIEIARAGAVVGIGLSRYNSAEAARICGKKSFEIAQILGYPARAALVHRDDMANLNFSSAQFR